MAAIKRSDLSVVSIIDLSEVIKLVNNSVVNLSFKLRKLLDIILLSLLSSLLARLSWVDGAGIVVDDSSAKKTTIYFCNQNGGGKPRAAFGGAIIIIIGRGGGGIITGASGRINGVIKGCMGENTGIRG
uniref:Uncharacterized protein n=1 Tax=Romanomermis culicivorax TaxID=13658 RepID=A0A915K7V9_ROMCU